MNFNPNDLTKEQLVLLLENTAFHLRCVSGSRNSFSSEASWALRNGVREGMARRQPQVEKMHTEAAEFLSYLETRPASHVLGMCVNRNQPEEGKEALDSNREMFDLERDSHDTYITLGSLLGRDIIGGICDHCKKPNIGHMGIDGCYDAAGMFRRA